MSDAYRLIPITLDVSASARRVIVGSSLAAPDSRQTMHIYYGTQVLFRASMFSGSLSIADNPPTSAAWLFGIDEAFTANKPDLVLSSNDQFNIAEDWTGEDSLNVAAGRICFRADLTTNELKAALNLLTATLEYKTMYAYLWMLTDAGNVLKAVWPVIMHRVAVDPSTATPVAGITHLTTEAAAASYVPQWGDQARWRWKNGGWQYLFEEDNKWSALAPKIVDGVRTLAFGDPEEE